MKTKTPMMSLFALVLCTPAHAFFLCANKTTQAVRYPHGAAPLYGRRDSAKHVSVSGRFHRPSGRTL